MKKMAEVELRMQETINNATEKQVQVLSAMREEITALWQLQEK